MTCSRRSSPASARCPHRPDPADTAPTSTATQPPAATSGSAACPQHDEPPRKINTSRLRSAHALRADSGQTVGALQLLPRMESIFHSDSYGVSAWALTAGGGEEVPG